MAVETLEMVSVRLKSEQIEEIDQVVGVLGGNRSDFVRMAVDDRLAKLRNLVALSHGQDYDPLGVIPSE